MEIYREPADYQALGAEVIYGIAGTDIQKTIEVAIWAGDERETVGIKRFCGAEKYQVNVAGYLRGLVRVEPYWSDESGIVAAATRSVAAGISMGNATTQGTVLTAGSKSALPFRRLSDAPEKMAIAPGEWDELAWIAPGCDALVQIRFGARAGSDLEIVSDGVICKQGMSVFLLNMNDIAGRVAAAGRMLSQFRTMEVGIVLDGETAFSQHYILEEACPENVRICWVNEYGAVDYHTFHGCAEERMAISKNRLDGAQGYEILASESETRLTLVSQYEPRQTMRWLAGLAATPKVWRVRNDVAENENSGVVGKNRFEAVDVLTGQVVIHKTGALSRLEITIRPALKTRY